MTPPYVAVTGLFPFTLNAINAAIGSLFLKCTLSERICNGVDLSGATQSSCRQMALVCHIGASVRTYNNKV